MKASGCMGISMLKTLVLNPIRFKATNGNILVSLLLVCPIKFNLNEHSSESEDGMASCSQCSIT